MKENEETPKIDDDEKLDKFKADIINDADLVEEQSDKANEDMRFINVDGGMWEGFLESDFATRVKLQLDLVSNYVQRFIGEWNQNRVGVEFKPDDSKTSDDDAELLNGIYRADFRNNSGKLATDNAVDEAATCGYGALKVHTFFEDEEDPENENQRIGFSPIYNPYNTIIWDGSAQRIDKRDARRCTELTPFTPESFEESYPGKSPVSAYTPNTREFENVQTTTPQVIYIAKRYEVVRKKELVFVYSNLQTGEIETYSKEDHELIKDELKADEFREKIRERKVLRQSVEKTVFSGEEILEPTKRIAGKWIPIIPFYGYRAFVDGVEWYHGLVRKLKDAARLFNMQVSQLAENAASSGQEVPIFDPDQVEGPDMDKIWSDKNNAPYLLARALRDKDGNPIAYGPLGYSKPPVLDQSTSTLLQIVPSFVESYQGGPPQDSLDPNASGKAINAMIKRGNMNTQVINDNIANAITWSGEVYQSQAAEVYTTKRIIRTIGKDGTEGEKQLLKTVLDDETGRLIETNTIVGKKFRSYADVGPQYDTLREQTVEELKGMLEVFVKSGIGAQYTDAMVAILLDNITGVGLDPLKELNRRLMLTQGIVKPENDEEEAFVAQVQQQAQQEDPQQQLIEAASEQQRAEARNLDSKSLSNTADAAKKEAETIEIFADIQNEQNKTGLQAEKQANEARQQTLKTLESLPLQ